MKSAQEAGHGGNTIETPQVRESSPLKWEVLKGWFTCSPVPGVPGKGTEGQPAHCPDGIRDTTSLVCFGGGAACSEEALGQPSPLHVPHAGERAPAPLLCPSAWPSGLLSTGLLSPSPDLKAQNPHLLGLWGRRLLQGHTTC